MSPKKPSSLPEVAKQRELSGTVETEANSKTAKQISESKSKELSGSDIFGPPPEVPARPLAARNLELQGNLDFALPKPRSIHTSVKVSNVRGFFYLNIFFSLVDVNHRISQDILNFHLISNFLYHKVTIYWQDKVVSDS